MIPLTDDIPARRFPVVNVGLIAANAVVFLFYELPHLDAAIAQASFYPCDVTRGCHLGLPWGISWLTAMFLHGNWHHIFGNMVYLLVFGKNVECALGRIGYLCFYLAGGLAATILQTTTTLLYSPSPDAREANLGASGAIAAVLGAYIVFYPKSRVAGLAGWRPFVSPAWFFLGFWFVFQLFEAVLGMRRPDATSGSGVAFFAHVGGFILGVLVALVLTLTGRISIDPTTEGVQGNWFREVAQNREAKPVVRQADANTSNVKCPFCLHVQAVPRGQVSFVCEQCKVKLEPDW
jgi:membrane associated rhomboid family serine protease